MRPRGFIEDWRPRQKSLATSASQVHRAMRREVCPGTSKAARFSVGPPSTTSFARGVDFPLPKPVRSAILVSKRPRIWRMSVETETDTVVCFLKGRRYVRW